MSVEVRAVPSFASLERMSGNQGARKLAAGLLGNLLILALLIWGEIPSSEKTLVASRVQMVSLGRLPEPARLPEVMKPIVAQKLRPASKAKIFEAPRPGISPNVEMPSPPRVEPVQLEEKVALPAIEAPSMPIRKPIVGTFVSTALQSARAERQTAQIVTGGFGSSTAKTEHKQSPTIVTAGLFAREGPAMNSKPGDRARLETQSGFENSEIVSQRSSRLEVAAGGEFGGSKPSVPRERSSSMTMAGSFDAAPPTSKRNRLERGMTGEMEFKGVEIFSKPRPLYTEEARQLGIEGEVHLRILFGANGRLKVLAVVRGLGHGLDESAVLAATQIQFRPASKQGQAIEQSAIVRVQFQLAN